MSTQTDYIKKLEQVSKMTADEAKKAKAKKQTNE